jgi:hypothetical protein
MGRLTRGIKPRVRFKRNLSLSPLQAAGLSNGVKFSIFPNGRSDFDMVIKDGHKLINEISCLYDLIIYQIGGRCHGKDEGS